MEALMALDRSVGLKGFKYRGGGPMITWMLHRITGLAIVLFVGTHVISSFFMQQIGSDWATAINTVYESMYFQFVVIFVVLFHALNGLRIIVLDLWPKMLEYQREATWLEWLVFVPLYGMTVVIMILNKLNGG
jgi:succinate dehydrogenase / fumarate reductase cytochrome b subunit